MAMWHGQKFFLWVFQSFRCPFTRPQQDQTTAALLLSKSMSALSPSLTLLLFKKFCFADFFFFLTWPNKTPDNDKQVSKTSGTSKQDLICQPRGRMEQDSAGCVLLRWLLPSLELLKIKQMGIQNYPQC